MENLLKETAEKLKDNGKTPDDVLWVGSVGSYSTWENFAIVANVEYDSGYGGAEVAEDLLVVGKNWWLERHEYDGSEWWEFKSLPPKPKRKITIVALTENQAKDLGFDVYAGSQGLEALNNMGENNE